MIAPLVDFIFNNQGGEDIQHDKDGIVDNTKNESGRKR